MTRSSCGHSTLSILIFIVLASAACKTTNRAPSYEMLGLPDNSLDCPELVLDRDDIIAMHNMAYWETMAGYREFECPWIARTLLARACLWNNYFHYWKTDTDAANGWTTRETPSGFVHGTPYAIVRAPYQFHPQRVHTIHYPEGSDQVVSLKPVKNMADTTSYSGGQYSAAEFNKCRMAINRFLRDPKPTASDRSFSLSDGRVVTDYGDGTAIGGSRPAGFSFYVCCNNQWQHVDISLANEKNMTIENLADGNGNQYAHPTSLPFPEKIILDVGPQDEHILVDGLDSSAPINTDFDDTLAQLTAADFPPIQVVCAQNNNDDTCWYDGRIVGDCQQQVWKRCRCHSSQVGENQVTMETFCDDGGVVLEGQSSSAAPPFPGHPVDPAAPIPPPETEGEAGVLLPPIIPDPDAPNGPSTPETGSNAGNNDDPLCSLCPDPNYAKTRCTQHIVPGWGYIDTCKSHDESQPPRQFGDKTLIHCKPGDAHWVVCENGCAAQVENSDDRCAPGRQIHCPDDCS